MIANYFKTAWRNLIRNKTYSLINILGLSIGLGGFILLLLYLNHELRYDKWHPELKKVYRLGLINEKSIAFDGNTPSPLGKFLQSNLPEVDAVTKIQLSGNYEALLTTGDKKIYQKGVVSVDSSFFRVFPYELSKGNVQTALNTPNAVILGEELSKKLFGDADPINKTIKIHNAFEGVITGVIKPSKEPSILKPELLFQYPNANNDPNWQNFSYHTFIKLKNETDVKKLESDINRAYYNGHIKKDSSTYNDYIKKGSVEKLFAERMQDLHNFPKAGGSDFSTISILLMLAALLLIGGAINFSNLSIAASMKRAKEVGVRKVLGSGKGQLFWQFMSEIALQCLISLLFALLILGITLPLFNNEFHVEISIFDIKQGGMFIQIFLCLLIIIILSGLYPSLFLTRFNTTQVLKGNYSQGTNGSIFKTALIILQFTMSAFFIIASIVISRQMHFMQSKDKGFSSDQVMRVQIQQKTGEQNFENTRNTLLAVPGVEYVAKSTKVPGDRIIDTSSWNYKFEGKEISLGTVKVSKDYLNTIHASLLYGRDFDGRYADENTRSAIINEAAAAKLGMENPTGKTIYFEHCDTVPIQIIGVIKNFALQDFSNSIRPEVYTINNKACGYLWGGGLLIKLKRDNIQQSIAGIEEAWKKIDPDFPIQFSFLDDNFQKLYASHLRVKKIIISFSLIAVLIAIMGLFALTAYMAKEKTKEIGIRKVLGASISDINILLGKNFLRMILIAVLISVPLGWLAANKWLQTFAYRIALSWTIFAMAVLIVLVIAFVTISLQTIKAALANPVKSLRSE